MNRDLKTVNTWKFPKHDIAAVYGKAMNSLSKLYLENYDKLTNRLYFIETISPVLSDIDKEARTKNELWAIDLNLNQLIAIDTDDRAITHHEHETYDTVKETIDLYYSHPENENRIYIQNIKCLSDQKPGARVLANGGASIFNFGVPPSDTLHYQLGDLYFFSGGYDYVYISKTGHFDGTRNLADNMTYSINNQNDYVGAYSYFSVFYEPHLLESTLRGATDRGNN